MAASPASAPPPTRERIAVRRMDLEFPSSIPTFWFDGNPFLTAVMAGLAVSFPPGERFFIRSVKHFLPEVEDPELRAAVHAFIGQEANHTKEHIAFNRFLDGKGFPATQMEEWVARRIAKLEKLSPPSWNLARTVALEHFTAILASALLDHPEVIDRLSPETATLWMWHAIEEVEHRAVAFDVYKATVDDEALRLRIMAATSLVFFAMNVLRTTWLLHAFGRLFDLRSTARGLDVLLRRPGMLRKVLPQYLAFYRRDFHPSQHDVGAALAAAKARYLGELA